MIVDPKVRILSDVPRWAIVRTVRKQNVAEHSYHVAMITMNIIEALKGMMWEISPEFEYECLLLALSHDVDESISGDIPATYKRRLPRAPTPNASKLPYRVVKLADCIEAMAFLMEDQALGNVSTGQVVRDLWNATKDAAHALLGNTVAPGDLEAFIRMIQDEMDQIATTGHDYASYIPGFRLAPES